KRPAPRPVRTARAQPAAGRAPRPPGEPGRHGRRRRAGAGCALRRAGRGRPRAVPRPCRCGGGRAGRVCRRPGAMNRPMERLFDARHIRRAFSRAADGYDAAAALQAEVRTRLLESLAYLDDTVPAVVLDVGSGTGHAAAAMKKRWPGAQVLAIDLALPMLRQARRQSGWRRPLARVCADARALPLAEASVDVIFSNLCLQWVEDLPAVFAG